MLRITFSRGDRLAATRSGAFARRTSNPHMVLTYHLIITAYGFWLPNDPRGSWSDFVGSWELWKFGEPTKVDTPTSRARIKHDNARREEARAALKYTPVEFTGTQARAIARGFADYIQRAGLLVWACSILPDHVHMVIARSHLKIESIATQLKGAATRRIIAEGIHPLAAYQKPGLLRGRPPKMWARGEWKVFLDSIDDILRAIRYVENNPLKEGKKRQRWSFVTAFDPAAVA
jgi:REP element-mobilizing transposase RayT